MDTDVLPSCGKASAPSVYSPLLAGCDKTDQRKHRDWQLSSTCDGAAASWHIWLQITSAVTSQDFTKVAQCQLWWFYMPDAIYVHFSAPGFVLFDYDRTWRKHQLLMFLLFSWFPFTLSHCFVSFLLVTSSMKLMTYLPNACFSPPFPHSLYFNTSLFTISSIFVSFFFPHPSLEALSLSSWRNLGFKRSSALHSCKTHRRTEEIAKAPPLLW